MIKQRHSWTKRKKNKKIKDENGKEYIICFVHECKYCGLLRGSIKLNSRRYGKTVYFIDNMVVSWDRVPVGGCNTDIGKIDKIIKEGYFSKEDFKIE